MLTYDLIQEFALIEYAKSSFAPSFGMDSIRQIEEINALLAEYPVRDIE